MEEYDTHGTMTLNELETSIHSMVPDLVFAAEKPVVENPFRSLLILTTSEKIKVMLGILLVPLRLLLMLLLFLTASLLSKIFLIGYTEPEIPEPFTGFRRFGQTIIWFLARSLLFIYGFFHIKTKGKLADAQHAPIIVIAPHTSFLDALFLGCLGTTVSFVGKKDNNKVFLIGPTLRLVQPMSVDRTKKNSKQYVIKELKRRASGGWPQIVLFPEGTTTNGQAFITFKPGAFYPGLPVQPVILKYKDSIDYASWTWMGPGMMKLLVILTSRLINHAEVEILPVYKPSQEEIDDPFLFARNVRDVMATAAAVPVTEHSYDDCRLMSAAKKLGLPMEAGLVEFYKLSPMIGMNCDCMIDYMKKFAEMDKNKDGFLDIDEFCGYLNLPLSEELRTIFRIYDIDKDDCITFREYLLGFTLISRPFNTEKNIRSAFSLFDPEDTGYINYENLADRLKSTMVVGDKYTRKIFDDMDREKTGKPDYDAFQEFCVNKPEYTLLFIHFRKLHADSSSMTVSKVVLRRSSLNEADSDILRTMPEVAI